MTATGGPTGAAERGCVACANGRRASSRVRPGEKNLAVRVTGRVSCAHRWASSVLRRAAEAQVGAGRRVGTIDVDRLEASADSILLSIRAELEPGGN